MPRDYFHLAAVAVPTHSPPAEAGDQSPRRQETLLDQIRLEEVQGLLAQSFQGMLCLDPHCLRQGAIMAIFPLHVCIRLYLGWKVP